MSQHDWSKEERRFACLFVWCLTAHQHKRPLVTGFGQYANVVDEIVE